MVLVDDHRVVHFVMKIMVGSTPNDTTSRAQTAEHKQPGATSRRRSKPNANTNANCDHEAARVNETVHQEVTGVPLIALLASLKHSNVHDVACEVCFVLVLFLFVLCL